MVEPTSCFKSRTEFQTLKVLGSGTFGIVLHVRKRTDFTECVMKEVNLTEIELQYGKSLAEASRNEYKTLKQFRHPNVLRAYGAFEERYEGDDVAKRGCTLYCLITEYCKLGDLQSAIDEASKAGKPFEESILLRWTSQLLSALKQLHDQDFVHRDIKPKNIFLFDRETVKLGDFGLAQSVNAKCEDSRFCTKLYTAPEYFQGKPYTPKCDIWSLGVTLYQIANLNKLPFYDKDDINKAEPLPFSNTYSAQFRNLVAKMLTKDPDFRPSVKTLLDDPLITWEQKVKAKQPAPSMVPTSNDTSKPVSDEFPAVQAAVERGDLTYLRGVHRLSPLFHQTNGNSDGLLNLAVLNGQLAVVQFLVDEISLNVEHRGRGGATPLLQACSRPGQLKIVRYLVERKHANIFAETDDGWKAIHFAASFADVEIVRYLLEKRPEWLHAKSGYQGRSPLLHAARYGNMPIVQCLVEERNANIKSHDANGWTALHLAAYYDHPDVVCYLLGKRSKLLDEKDNEGRTALCWAGRCSSQKVAAALPPGKTVSKAFFWFLREYYACENESAKSAAKQ